MKVRSVIRLVLIALIVVVLGALSGWYLVLNKATKVTVQQDEARGYTDAASLGSTTLGGGGASGIGGGGGGGTGAVGTYGTVSGAGGVSGFFSSIYNTIFGISERPSRPDTGATAQSALISTASTSSAAAPTTPRFWQVTRSPIAGVGFVTVNGRAYIRYVERQTGNVIDVDPNTGTSTRRTNTLIPKTYQAFILSNDRVVLRSEEDGVATTFSGTIASSSAAYGDATTSQTLSGARLLAGMNDLTTDGTGKLIYVAAGIMRSAPDGTKQETLFSTPLQDWRLQGLSDRRIIIAEKPADGIAGHAYELKAGVLSELVPEAPGLATLAHASTTALVWSTSDGTTFRLFSRKTADDAGAQLPIRTVVDKCAWGSAVGSAVYCGVPQGAVPSQFLAKWYRGEVHTNDAIYSVDVGNGTAKLLYTPEGAVDVSDAVVDPTNTYLAFINARDRSLYILRIGS